MSELLIKTNVRTEIRPGMLVNLRRRIWRVEDVSGGILTAMPIDDFGARPQQFLLDLEKVEPGTVAPPSLESLGDHTLQGLLLQAIRLDALHGAAPFVSLQRTAVIPVEYQLVPLVMALRQHPVRLLIADTTGLGKTIEAGLIALELLARGRARSVLIVTPASLRDQWREQMRDLFYLDFDIISGETRKSLERTIPPGADPWLYFDRLIVSIDYAKDIRIRPEILKRQWDIVIVDECHNAAMPHSQAGRRADMDRWEALHQIAASASQHLLLLSATPHNGYTDSYCSLLSMLSPDLVTQASDGPRPVRAIAQHHVCQRTRTDVQGWFEEAGKDFPFPKREPTKETEIEVDLHRDYIQILRRLDTVLEYLADFAARAGRAQAAEWLRLHLHRRALSSPEALRRSLENRIERLRAAMQRQMGDETDEPLLWALGDKGASDVESEEDRDRTADSAVLNVAQERQLELFGELLDDLRAIKPAKDRKLTVLRDQVIPSLLKMAGENTPARIIIFTRFRDTLSYLERELSQSQHTAASPKREPDESTAYAIVSLHGELSAGEREQRYQRFVSSERAVLLATDVISEGLNLQSACCMVVHADLPYNPNRIDQRNGRVDRFGQRAPTVYIRTLYCKDTTDEDVLELLVRKMEQMRRDLGFSPPMFATENTVLRVLTRRRKRRAEHADPKQPTLFDFAETGEPDDLIDEGAVHRMRSEGFYGQADVRISDVSARLKEVHSRFGSPDQIRRFIQVGLRRFGCSVQEKKDGTLRIEINNPRLRIAGLPTVLEKVVLDPAEHALHADAVVLDVGHPLVRRLNTVIREDALRQTDQGGRTAAYYVKGQRGTILVGHGLLRATAATDPPTLLEEVVQFGIRGGIEGYRKLAPDELEVALQKPPSPRSVDRGQALQMLTRLHGQPALAEAEAEARQNALRTLRDARVRMKAELYEADKSEWLKGFEDVQEVGFDLYCLTLLMPEGI